MSFQIEQLGGQRGIQTSSCQEKVQVAEIPEALASQSKELQSLHGLLSTLEERLSCITRKEPTNINNEKQVAAPPIGNQISSIIREYNRGISVACNRIQELIRLLEV